MASEAANRPKTATATVLRATERQIRIRLGKAYDDREVTKRVPVPAELRDQLEGAKVRVVITGSGEKAKVELADDWASGVGAAKKPAAKKAAPAAKKATPTAKKAAPAAKKPAAATTKRAAAKQPATPAAEPKAPAAKADDGASAAPAAEKKPRSRSRSRGRRAVEDVAKVATVAPTVIAERIAAAVELVRSARR